MAQNYLVVGLICGACLCACEGQRYRAAVEADSVQLYRRFIADYPLSARIDDIRRRLHERAFQRAVAAKSVLGLRAFLATDGRGPRARDAREHLSKLLLWRATTPTQIRQVITLYPKTAAARLARKRLARLEAGGALKSQSIVAVEAALPSATGPLRAKLRARAASLRLAAAGDDPESLGRLIERYGDTPSADHARLRLRKVLMGLARFYGDSPALRRLSVHLGKRSSDVAAFEQAVRRFALLDAVRSLDMVRLRQVQAPDGLSARLLADIKALQKLCRRAERCAAPTALSRAVQRWRSPSPDAKLSTRAYAPSLAHSWAAIAALGWSDSEVALRVLADLVGSQRLSVVWLAHDALARVRARSPKRLMMLAQAPKHRRNQRQSQRYGILRGLAGDRRIAAPVLARLAAQGPRVLVAGYLLLKHGLATPEQRAAWLKHAEKRAGQLIRSFPRTLSKESLVTAQVIAHELFALATILGDFKLAPQLQRRIKDSLARLATRARKLKWSGPRDPRGALVVLANAHQQKRQAAMQRLARRTKQPAYRALRVALCEVQSIRRLFTSACEAK